ncbi:MAG: hypothetical protein D6702_09545 [Planctomycetota bacterium]|nr:MAG: hypothetical protein D6702_09545 [Planctomycetota bacterium]
MGRPPRAPPLGAQRLVAVRGLGRLRPRPGRPARRRPGPGRGPAADPIPDRARRRGAAGAARGRGSGPHPPAAAGDGRGRKGPPRRSRGRPGRRPAGAAAGGGGVSRFRRIGRAALVYGVFLALILARLVQLQVLERETWRAEAIRARSSGRTLPFERGRILDRRGRVEAEDQRAFVLRFEYRSFRRGHLAGQIFEACRLAGLPVGGLTDAWRRAEELGRALLSLPAETVRELPAGSRGDLLFYLERIGGLPRSRRPELEFWAQEGTGPFPWPPPAEGFLATLERLRRSWQRLEALVPEPPLLPRLEEERRRLELRLRFLALREAAAAATGSTRLEVLEALAGADRRAFLEALLGRWRLAAAAGDELADALRRSRAPSGEEEAWFGRTGELLRRIEAAAPEDLAGVRRRLEREVHSAWRPILARDLDWRLVDLVGQDPESYPGLQVEEVHVRRYPGSLDPHLLGYLRQPGEEELEEYETLRAERRALARKLDPTPAETRELARLDRLLLREVRRPDDWVAVQGAERAGDEVLAGRRGLLRRLRWDEDEPVELEFLPPANGGDLRLALDEAWSQAAVRAVHEGYALALQGLDARPGGSAVPASVRAALARPRAGFVLLDLRDGTVPVAVTVPSYDPETFRRDYRTLAEDPARPLRHRALGSAADAGQIPYPGSTFKLVAAVEALSRDPSWWTRTFRCERHYLPPYATGTRLSCTGRHGEIDLRAAIRVSCNIYFYHLAEELGWEALEARARSLGFGEATTGLDLTSRPGPDGRPEPLSSWLEVGSRLHPPDGRGRGRLVNAMRLAIGQTYVEASPLQMARFYGWLACGRLWRPRMVLERDGRPTEPEWREPPLDPGLRRLLEQALLDVTGPEGTAWDRAFQRYQLRDFAVAGKTGTAQVGRGADGRELPTHAWFAGWFPAGPGAGPPRYAVAVLCENAGLHGGWIATYVLHRFLEQVGEELLR